MLVEVRLFATLRNNREKKVYIEALEYITPLEILAKVGIEKEEVAILLINGRTGLFNKKLIEGDYLSVFPPVGGG